MRSGGLWVGFGALALVAMSGCAPMGGLGARSASEPDRRTAGLATAPAISAEVANKGNEPRVAGESSPITSAAKSSGPAKGGGASRSAAASKSATAIKVPGIRASTGTDQGRGTAPTAAVPRPVAPPDAAEPKQTAAAASSAVLLGAAEPAQSKPPSDSVNDAYRLALLDMVESANASQLLSRLGDQPTDVVVLQVKVRKDGGFHLKSVKSGAKPESVGAAMAAVERAAPLLPPPDGKSAAVKLTFLFRTDGRFKLR